MSALQFWINVVALILSPLIAVQVTEVIRGFKQRRERRLWIFRVLMVNRGTAGLAPETVQALNLIDLDYRNTKAVLKAWESYFQHLNTAVTGEEWGKEKEARLKDLLAAMAKDLRYKPPHPLEPTTAYAPIGHGRVWWEQEQIRIAILELLQGKRAVPIVPILPQQRPPIDQQKPDVVTQPLQEPRIDKQRPTDTGVTQPQRDTAR
jgi:hypothetical protein